MTATTSPPLDRRGLALGAAAHVVWGLFPAFWALLAPAGPIEALAHRLLWTMVLMVVVLSVVGGWPALRALPRRGWLATMAEDAVGKIR